MQHRLSLTLLAVSIATAGLVWSSDFMPSSAGASPSDPVGELIATAPAAASDTGCEIVGFETAAQTNRASLSRMRFSPFGRAETGWETYAPRIANDIESSCNPDTPGFAQALSKWQLEQGLPADGAMSPATIDRLKSQWQGSRPYVALRASGVCPDAPSETSLTRLTAEEGYKGKAIMLRSEVAAAYRAMVSAAKAEVPEIAADGDALDVFSGFRSPAYDDARCARDGNCGGVTRAKCSAHRTGYTFDLVVGAAPGHSVDSTNDQNRLHMSKTAAYRWLVENAGQFGFVNYVFEPWHWEYVGSGVRQDVIQASIR